MRAGEPPGGSTLITSAPRSPSICPHSSPRSVVRSSTRYVGVKRRLTQVRQKLDQRGIHLSGLFLLRPMARTVDVHPFEIGHPSFHAQRLLGPQHRIELSRDHQGGLIHALDEAGGFLPVAVDVAIPV